MIRSLLALTFIAFTALARAQDPAAIAASAEKAWAERNWEDAASRYGELTRVRPDSADGWHRLGYSLHMLGRLDEALPAHEKAAALATPEQGEIRALAIYNAACVHARLGRTDEAFAALERSVAAGYKDAAAIGRDADLASLRTDARFEKLLTALAAGRRTVAIVVHEGVEMLDFAGPAEVFAAARTRLGGPCYEVVLVAPSAGPIHAQHVGGTIVPAHTIADCPHADVVLVPGGDTRRLEEDAKFLAWFRTAAVSAEHVVSVCTGAFVLAKTGFLDGKEATTHHSSLRGLEENYPAVKVVRDVRFVDNGKMITAGGIAAGIDAALHVVERDFGKDVAAETARYMEYPWPPAAEKTRIAAESSR